MYPVTEDFIQKMKADRRQVLARVEVDYTDPFLDQSLEIEANDQANVSYPQQTADSVDQTTHKYACLDGTWDLTTGEYHLAPSQSMLSRYQMGWWGAQFADQDGYFAQPYPTLTVRHLPRPIRQFKVIGDSARGEYPVDFTIRLYAQDGTLLKTESITGNTQIIWQKDLEPQVLDVAKQELIITRWSLPGTCAKIIEFFTSIREVYETGDLVSIRLLEEREASQGSLPVGNISSNEITLALNNEDKKFDIDNENSPLKNLLKPNRRIQAWLGAEAENAAAENPPTFTRNSPAYLSDGTQVAANAPRFEPGKFGKAVMVEEGTENLLANPTFIGESGLASCFLRYDYGGQVTYEIVQDSYLPSTLSQRLYYNSPTENGSEMNNGILVKIAGQIDDVFTLTFYGKGWEEKGSIDIYMRGALSLGMKKDTLENGWTKYTNIIKLTGTTCDFYIRPNRNREYSFDCLINAPQLEQKPYATSFIDGTRAAENLTIPTAGVWNKGGWEQTFSFKPTSTQAVAGKTGYLWDLCIDADNYYALKVGSDGKPYLEVKSNGTTYQTATTNAPAMSTGTWYTLSIRGNGSQMALFVNGSKVSEVSYTEPLGDLPQYMYLGSDHNGANHANGLYDDLRISSRARSDAEILAAYQSGQPLERDAYTTYLLSFNGSIYPVEQCWVPLGTFWSLDWDSPDDTLEATVTARDRMELLRKGTYQTSQVLTNKSLYELAEGVLQDAGLSSNEYVIDTTLNNIRVPYAWFNPVSHREALRRIAEAGLAAAFQNRDGKIQIESFLISGDEPVLEITDDDYFPPLRTPSRQQDVANEIVVDTQPLRPALVPEEVYRSNEPIAIPANSTQTLTVYYNKTPVIDAIATLDSPPAGVAITETTYYGWGASIKIANIAGTDQQVVLVITGRPLTVQNKERAVARDEASILENGLLTYEFPANPLVQTLAQAQAIANTLLASVKDPRRDIEVEWRGNPALELGDRVTVKGKDYHVIRQEINWQGYLSARLTGRKA